MTPKELGQKLIDGEAKILPVESIRDDRVLVVFDPPSPKPTRGEEIAEKMVLRNEKVLGAFSIGAHDGETCSAHGYLRMGLTPLSETIGAVAIVRGFIGSAIDAAIADAERREREDIIALIFRVLETNEADHAVKFIRARAGAREGGK